MLGIDSDIVLRGVGDQISIVLPRESVPDKTQDMNRTSTGTVYAQVT